MRVFVRERGKIRIRREFDSVRLRVEGTADFAFTPIMLKQHVPAILLQFLRQLLFSLQAIVCPFATREDSIFRVCAHLNAGVLQNLKHFRQGPFRHHRARKLAQAYCTLRLCLKIVRKPLLHVRENFHTGVQQF